MLWKQTTQIEKDIPDKEIIYCHLGDIHIDQFAPMVGKIGYEYFVLNDRLYRIKNDGDKINVHGTE